MKKLLVFLLPIFLASAIFLFITIVFLKRPGKGTLQVTSVPTSTIYLNGKFLGKTPYPKADTPPLFDSGEYNIKLVPDDQNFESFDGKISIADSVLTAVDRTFAKDGASEGSIISLAPLKDAKDAEILVTSFPEKAEVRVDNNLMGQTPLLMKDIPESDHELKLTLGGYKQKTVPIRTKTGYKLLATVFLGIKSNIEDVPSPSSTPSATPSQSPKARVIILETPNGFLNVRDSGSINSNIIAKIHPGESYDLISETEGWYEILLADGKSGWISSLYAKKE